MSHFLSKYQFHQSRFFLQRHSNTGFTLIELLVSAVVGSTVVSALLGLVINILETDRQDLVRNQLQQEMQNALDYISEDIKESVYVYSGECIQGQGTAADPSTFCPGIINHIPVSDKSVPVLAFWKVELLPDGCQSTLGLSEVNDPCYNSRIANRTFSLVVYYLRQNQASESNSPWQGKARITRYVLSQFNSESPPKQNAGYFNPLQAGTSFRFWPFTRNTSGVLENQQTSTNFPTASGINPAVLVDFVDDTPDAENSTTICPSEYVLTPSNKSLEDRGLAKVRGFYACVREQQNQQPDVIVHLRGNTHRRQGGYGEVTLSNLKVHVLGRGVIDKKPG
ncbi:prepilin-type N-terminal cleavage/methylation domain-containing protein [Gloeocapsopsis sp. IPPAS B-1203]|uniref:prepilin-type N-terminal cleavage/methylation domain-containing protein n=1 Tax=Gloeocapsopsis sp. IPPAS B-1203 TaxID=2049454 RepID=UPI000C176BE0|nr:prepilin-type N-terminal cleavage/methylation domain-containing protein [Gloeocapsopsis sp. IPPAS B-1203]PIG91373.1 hypothetical protein CSQ79_22055 [Gloeocapsopsis sp. IPPAS B-1203]